MAIHIKGFAGEIPRLQPRYLPDQNARTAKNVRLDRGDLEPIKDSVLAHTPPAIRAAIYKHGDTWLTFTDRTVRVVPGPVATDRLYITCETLAPRVRFAGTDYALALPAPVTPPVLSRAGTLDTTLQEMVLYAYTWLTGMGEESQPCPAAGIYWSPGCTITLGGMPAPPTGRNITKKRIYRSQTSASGETEFFFVAEITGSDVSFTHDLSSHPLQEAIPTRDFDPPPPAMLGITAMPNGIMAAFAGKELLFSEPYQPHAWPMKYRLAMSDEIVALAAFGSSLAVLTRGQPVVVQGLHPEAMAQRKLEQPYPCLSALGVVDAGYAAIYPSSDGLVEITESGGRIVSEATWTREQWGALDPSSFVAATINGRYVFSYTPAGTSTRQIGVLDLRAQPPSLSRINIASPFLWTEQASGRCYFLTASGAEVHELDPVGGAISRTMGWRSKPYFTGRPTAVGAAFVEAPEPGAGAGVRVIADGNVIAVIKPADFNRVVRLPAGRFNQFEVEVEGTGTITRISIGQSPDEVRL